MPLFESSVNLWGSQTLQKLVGNVLKFESSVNLWGSQTSRVSDLRKKMFESSVNLWGSQTVITVNERIACLRVV